VTPARVTGLAALALLLAAAPATAGPPGRWTRVTGAGAAVASTLDVGVARTPNGVLHVLWVRRTGPAASVLHSSLSADAKRVSTPRRVATYSGGVNESLDRVAVQGGLRAFFSGLQGGSPLDAVMASASSAGGNSWSAAEPVTRRTSEHTPYASAGMAAGAKPDGTVVSAWGSPGPGFHLGLDPGSPDGSFPAGTVTDPGVGVDAAGGQVVLAWHRLDEGGVAAMPVSPPGPRLTVPGPVAAQLRHRVGVSGRLGRPGVYVAYAAGRNQFSARPALWRFGAPRGRPVSRVPGARDVGVAAAPGGRLWLFWHRDGVLYATRSDPSARRFGALRSLAPPRRTRLIHDLAGEGSRGPLDLLVLLTRRRRATAHWHQRLLPGLTLAATSRSRGRLALRVSDAGVPVRGATVTVGGGGRQRSARDGSVSFRLASGSYRADAAKRGYASASLGVRVR
jgi:hypothetical protein